MSSRGHVVVVGGAGRLGGPTVLALRDRRYLVTAIDDLSTGLRHHADLAQHFVRLDVRDRTALQALLSNRPTHAVVHLAGLWGSARAQREPEVASEIDVGGTASLLGAMRAARLRRLVLVSDWRSGADLAPVLQRVHALREALVADCRAAWGLEPAVLRFGRLAGAAGADREAADPENLHVNEAASAIGVAVDRLLEGSVPAGPLDVGAPGDRESETFRAWAGDWRARG